MHVRVLHIKMNSLRKGTCLLKLKKTSPPKYMGVSHWKNKQVFKQPPLFKSESRGTFGSLPAEVTQTLCESQEGRWLLSHLPGTVPRKRQVVWTLNCVRYDIRRDMLQP